MNSKQRVLKALSLKQSDVIPYGEYAIDFEVIEKALGHETYLRAKAKSKIALWEGRRDEVVQSWKEDLVEFYSKFDCIDIINLAAEASGLVPPKNYNPNPPKKIDSNTWEDSEGKIYKYSDVTKDITMVNDPKTWERVYDIKEFQKEVNIEKPDESMFEVIDYVIEKLGDKKFIIGPAGREVGMVLLGGMERGLMEYMLHPDVVKAASIQQIKMGNQEDAHYIRNGVDAILWGQDFSYNSGPMMSPEMFREFVYPSIKARVKNIKENHKLPIIKHACGNNWKLMDMFVELGYDGYQSIQDSAGMGIKEVKEKYGDKMCLWGGINYEYLVNGTRDDIKKDMEYTIKYASQGGGLILGSSHSVGIGSNYDNFLGMMEYIENMRNNIR